MKAMIFNIVLNLNPGIRNIFYIKFFIGLYRTKVKTLHIYSSSKIALILFLRNKMKSHIEISSFGETHVQRKW